MFSLPQPSDWNALHVLVIHFPIALLMLAAPVLIGLAMIIPPASRQLAAAAAVMLMLGTGFCYLATNTGKAAEHLAKAQGALEDPAIHETLEEHEEMATKSRDYFTYFTAAFMLYLLIALTRKEPLHAGANAAILFLFLCGNGVLALGLGNAAHKGGELVHEHAILAPLAPGAGNAAAAASAGMDDEEAAEPEPEAAEAPKGT